MARTVASSRVLLVKDRRDTKLGPAAVPLRRYRLARLRFGDRPADPEGRLKDRKH